MKANLRIAEVPSTELPRRNGASNLHAFRDGKRVLRTLVRERVRAPPGVVVDPIDQRVLHEWRPAATDLRDTEVPREALSTESLT